MRALTDKLVGIVNRLEEDQVTKVLKTEQDDSYSTFLVESASFETQDGKTITITVRTPKVGNQAT